MELLLAAGYFRVRIKGLSEFDKVIKDCSSIKNKHLLDTLSSSSRWSVDLLGAFKHVILPSILIFSIEKMLNWVKKCETKRFFIRFKKRLWGLFRALTERIVLVLSRMKCPHAIEPHQIQGGDFIHIFPVVQWLVTRLLERRAEIGDFNRSYALSQFENEFHISSSNTDPLWKENIEAIRVGTMFHR